MVRLKTRWLLVRLDVEATMILLDDATRMKKTKKNGRDVPFDLISGEDEDERVAKLFPVRKDLATAIRQNITAHLGLAGEGLALDTQVRFWDPRTRLLLLRVPRDDCGKLRACLTLMTYYEMPPETTKRRFRMIASVLSVNGSARTAKRATLLHVRKWYQGRFQAQQQAIIKSSATSSTNNTTTSTVPPIQQGKGFDKDCRKLQDLITIIQAID